VAEDIILVVGILDGQIGVARRRGTLAPDRGRIVAVPIAVAGREGGLALGSLAVDGRRFVVPAPLARQGQRRRFPVPIPNQRDPFVVDRDTLAIGAVAVARQPLPYRDPRLALGSLALRPLPKVA